MVSAEAVRNTVGIIGNVISFGLFLSPAPTFWRIIKRKSVEEFQPYIYIFTCLNCICWVIYGLPVVHPDSILVVTINGVGLGITLIYLTIYCIYDHENKGRLKIGLGLLLEFLLVGAFAGVTFGVFHTTAKRSIFMGVICDVFNVAMYGAPLLIARKVIKTKSVEFMPFNVSLATFLNSVCWTIYALVKTIDLYVLISNSLGTILGLLQLILYGIYFRKTPKSDEVVKPAEVQLSGATRA